VVSKPRCSSASRSAGSVMSDENGSGAGSKGADSRVAGEVLVDP
jgi:hypothetical protein